MVSGKNNKKVNTSTMLSSFDTVHCEKQNLQLHAKWVAVKGIFSSAKIFVYHSIISKYILEKQMLLLEYLIEILY